MHYEIPPVSPEEATPLVRELVTLINNLLEQNQNQAEEIQQMRDEIATLKRHKAKPKFKSSKMDENTGNDDDDKLDQADEKKKRAGSAKRSKTANLQIHEDRVIAPAEPVPADARFKGYRDVVVQGLVIKTHNIRYRLCSLPPGMLADKQWKVSDGTTASGATRTSLRPEFAQLHPLPAPSLPCDPTAAAGAIEGMGRRHIGRSNRCDSQCR